MARVVDLIARKATHLARRVPTHGSRMAWFHAKRFAGISTRGDRSFLVQELHQLLDRGKIGPGLHIMCTGRRDGAGAQAMSKMSAMALANFYGLRYVHTPFLSIDHAENVSPATWARTWEDLLNLGHDEVLEDDCGLPHVGIEEFIGNSMWWNKPCVLVAGHFVRFTDACPQAYAAIADKLRAKYELTARATTAPKGEIIVCAHVRRGDVSAGDPETSHRAPNMVAFENSLRQVQGALAVAGVKARYKVFSQGSREGLESIEAMGCELNLNTPAIEAFRQLVDAHVLIMGRSSFSFVAALLGKGVRIYDRFVHPPVPGWLLRNEAGLVDQATLAWAVAGLASRERNAGKGFARTA